MKVIQEKKTYSCTLLWISLMYISASLKFLVIKRIHPNPCTEVFPGEQTFFLNASGDKIHEQKFYLCSRTDYRFAGEANFAYIPVQIESFPNNEYST